MIHPERYDGERSGVEASLLLAAIVLGGMLLQVALPGFGYPQVMTDGTLGPAGGPVASGVLPDGTPTDYLIGETLGKEVGSNLLHSFSQFSVEAGKSATFTGPNTIANILSRVTGGAQSSIEGSLNSTIPGANLFLMNPAGVVFGTGATLNIGTAANPGSFFATTANYVNLFDGTSNAKFYADSAKDGLSDSVLTVTSLDFGFLNPNGFGFSGANRPDSTVSIRVEGLNMLTGESVFLVGRDATANGNVVEGVEITGALRNRGGRVVIGSVDSAGQANLVKSASGATFEDVNLGDFARQGQIAFSNSTINTTGTSALRNGGDVVIRGGRFVATGAKIETRPRSGSFFGPSSGKGGGVLIATQQSASFANTTIETRSDIASGAGAVTITASGAETISLVNTTIDTQALFGGGDGGRVFLSAPTVDIQGGIINTGTSAGFFGAPAGNSGEIEFGVGVLKLSQSATVRATSGSKQPGQIKVGGLGGGQPADAVNITGDLSQVTATLLTSNTSGVGDGGDIVVNTRSFTLTGKAAIQSGTNRPGRAGSVTITAADSITIDNQFSDVSGGNILANSEGAGPGGDVTLTANELILKKGAVVTTETTASGNAGSVTANVGTLVLTGGSEMNSSATETSTGNAGTVTIQGLASPADSVRITNSSLLTRAEGDGRGGDIVVQGTNVSLDKATVAATAAGAGDGGSITIDAGDTFQSDNSTVSTAATNAGTASQGGDILLQAGQQIELTTTTVSTDTKGTGNAGNINIDAGLRFIMQGNSRLSTTAEQAPEGGDITVVVQDLFREVDSLITTSVGSETLDSKGGNIVIDPEFVILENSKILANAFLGTGGNIEIRAGVFLADATSVVDASSRFGQSGSVKIQSPLSNLSEAIAKLPQTPLQVAALLQARCAARMQGARMSSLVQTGRDSLPLGPGGWLPSPLLVGEAGAHSSAGSGVLKPDLMVDRLGLREVIKSAGWAMSDRIDVAGLSQECSL